MLEVNLGRLTSVSMTSFLKFFSVTVTTGPLPSYRALARADSEIKRNVEVSFMIDCS